MNHLYSYIKRDNRGDQFTISVQGISILPEKLKGYLHLHRWCVEKVAKSDHCGEPNLMFWVYVLKNPRGKYYVGQTENIAARIQDHNRTDCFDGHFTRKNGPWKLVWSETHSSRSSAVQRERQIKRMKSARWIREHLLAAHPAAVNPDESGL